MNREQALETIRAACKVYPEIKIEPHTGEISYRPIRLADVLLALESVGYVRGIFGKKKTVKLMPGVSIQQARQHAYGNEDGWTEEVTLSDPCKRIIIGWHLRADDLTKQTDEAILFIADLLK